MYGEPQADLKDRTWDALRSLNSGDGCAWLCSGDFNEILFAHEKQGGTARPHSCMEKFRLALEECGLMALGYKGDTFTWRNHSHHRERYIRERLDKAVVNTAWHSQLPLVEVINGDPRHYGHHPIIINLDGSQSAAVGTNKERCFKFEARWLKEDDYEPLVKKAWEEAFQPGATGVKEGLEGVAGVLKDWSHNVLGDLEKQIKRLKKKLDVCRRALINKEVVHKEQVL